MKKQRIKYFSVMLLAFALTSAISLAGQVRGTITFVTDGGVVAHQGQVILGKENFMSTIQQPEYLRAFAEATLSERFAEVDAQGKFLIPNAPEQEPLMLIITIDAHTYIVRLTLQAGEDRVVDRQLDLTVPSGDFKVKTSKATTESFLSAIGAVSFAATSGNEGWVIEGEAPKDSITSFKNVPYGDYNIFLLTKRANGVPDRCDVTAARVGAQSQALYNVVLE